MSDTTHVDDTETKVMSTDDIIARLKSDWDSFPLQYQRRNLKLITITRCEVGIDGQLHQHASGIVKFPDGTSAFVTEGLARLVLIADARKWNSQDTRDWVAESTTILVLLPSMVDLTILSRR
jgi:hypothetical protein